MDANSEPEKEALMEGERGVTKMPQEEKDKEQLYTEGLGHLQNEQRQVEHPHNDDEEHDNDDKD